MKKIRYKLVFCGCVGINDLKEVGRKKSTFADKLESMF
jgi:hypothetical protein